MAVRTIDRRDGSRPVQLSYPNFIDFRSESRVFEQLVGYRDAPFTLADSLPAVSVTGEIVLSYMVERRRREIGIRTALVRAAYRSSRSCGGGPQHW
jgi:hypothetical protein